MAVRTKAARSAFEAICIRYRLKIVAIAENAGCSRMEINRAQRGRSVSAETRRRIVNALRSLTGNARLCEADVFFDTAANLRDDAPVTLRDSVALGVGTVIIRMSELLDQVTTASGPDVFGISVAARIRCAQRDLQAILQELADRERRKVNQRFDN